jgi:DNA helicase-2/ATP-dependent DNA helicase PcrA
MNFYADFHIHSHFSLATSRLLTPEHLDRWGRIKGIRVVGTGDFTHPGWLAELKEKLDPAEPGLYRLKPALRLPAFGGAADADDGVRFLLTAEISCIYKRSDRVRKVHNVLFAPDFETAERIQNRLRSMDFNITSDGRPILGFDSRDLLELALHASPDVFFVPAHIWTPWFSALGDKSGFDSIRECYADLADHIHAVETGLSSDPPMNWLCSPLDSYALISNSDAHSPEKLGREANRFDAELSYPAITEALKHPDSGRFLGTVEFFPQEGKYHHDGHRKCGVSWTPEETARHGGICPVCGNKVTVGVLNRVHQLADRRNPDGKAVRPPFRSVIPLCEVLSEIRSSGPHSKAVQADYAALIRRLGSELNILLDAAEEDIRTAGGKLLVEAVRRMRAGRVSVEAGYDGEYGRIRVFGPEDRQSLSQESLFIGAAGPLGQPVRRGRKKTSKVSGGRKGSTGSVKTKTEKENAGAGSEADSRKSSPAFSEDSGPRPAEYMGAGGEPRKAGGITLNAEQEAAADHTGGPALVLAGPGTGKTRVLAGRILRLIRDHAVPPERILAITFTNKAAGEIRERVSAGTGSPEAAGPAPSVMTFHSFGHALLREHADRFRRNRDFRIADEEDSLDTLRSVSPAGVDVRRLAQKLRRPGAKAGADAEDPDAAMPAAEWSALLARYEDALRSQNMFDFDDLLIRPLCLFREDAERVRDIRGLYDHILVDEFQDVDGVQYEWIRFLAGPGPEPEGPAFWAVGDPDQSIYGFRGASPDFLRRFPEDFPGTTVYRLTQSYRCPENVLRASGMVLIGSSKFKVQSSKEEKDSGLYGDAGSNHSEINNQQSSIVNDQSIPLRGTDENVKVRIVRNASDASEAEFISRTIEAMTGGVRFFSMDSGITAGEEENPFGFSDFAVLCRISRQFPALEKALRDHGIPYRRSDTEPFYRREPAKAIVKVLKEVSVKGSGLAEKDLAALASAAGKEPVCDLIGRAAAGLPPLEDPADRIDLDLLAERSVPFGTDLTAFLTALALGSGPDWVRTAGESVALFTLHAAKGLEFPCVFIAGVEDGLLPCTLFGDRTADAEEERRLLYVGMTRAKKHLILSHADRRELFGRSRNFPRSPFIDAIEATLLHAGPAPVKRGRKSGRSQMDLF